MHVTILKEEKDILELQFNEETHTFCNLLRKELWENADLEAASYNLKHPLIATPHFIVKMKTGKPRKAVQEALNSLKKQSKELRTQLNKLS